MEFDEIVVKESPGLCRCCLSEGCYKDLATEYSWMDDTEVYAEMLLECFDISISQHNDGPNGPNRLICEVCITRLRDACNFKKQVLASEKKFVDMIGRGAFKPKVVLYPSPIKAEVNVEHQQQPVEPEVEYLEEEIDFGDVSDELIKEGDSDQMTISEDITVATLPVKGKRGRPRKNAVVKTNKKIKLAKTDEKPKTSKAVTKGVTTEGKISMVKSEINNDLDEVETTARFRRLTGYTAMERRAIMRSNVTKTLFNSTLKPFRWIRKFYKCFFCQEVFETPKEWKAHQTNHNIKTDLDEALKNHWESTVNVDVTDIACALCNDSTSDIEELTNHLINKHDVKFNTNIDRYINGFKFDDTHVYCVTCDRKYDTFSHVMVHMYRDHKKSTDVLCDICGQNSSSTYYLRLHIRSEHSGGMKCSQCNVKLQYTKIRTHMQKVHGKKYKCASCLEMFETQYKRAHHTMTVHGDREMVRCQSCPRTFVFKSTMLRHFRETHLREKNEECSICGWKCFGLYALQKHMLKHSSVRDIHCPSCDKTFKTKKTMKQHYVNIHQKT